MTLVRMKSTPLTEKGDCKIERKSRSFLVNVRDSEGESDDSDMSVSMVKSLHDFQGKLGQLY